MKHWGVDTSKLDKKVRPQDDFFHHVNNTWLRENPIPKEESWWGAFMQLRKKSDEQVRAIIRDVTAGKVRGDAAMRVARFYKSGMDIKSRNKKKLAPLMPYIRKIDSIDSTESLLRVVGELHRIGSSAFWDISVGPDGKDSTKNVLYFSQDGISLPDRDYYLKQDDESKRVRKAFQKYTLAVSKVTEIRLNPFEIEKALAHASHDKVLLRDPNKNYFPYTLSKLRAKAPLPWDAYFKGLGIQCPRMFVVCQPLFMRGAAATIASRSIEEHKAYLTWHLINTFAPYLHEPLIKAKFAFYGTELSGTKQMRPLWRRVQGVVEAHIGEELGKMYVERHFTHESKRAIDALVSNLFVAFEARIKNLHWMSAQTKRKALLKLRTMDRKIGYPKKWKTYAGLELKANDYCGNAINTNLFETRKAFRKIGKKVDRREWFMTPQTVNAYYNPQANEIVFPAAILQWPFFDARADAALNYGAIGWTIGHEMTHGFDDEGSKFDARGDLKGWWSKADRAHFDKLADVLRKQFNEYEPIPGHKVNGSLTLGENIADLGGVAIAYDAFQVHLNRHGRKNIDDKTPEQRFFLSLAQGEREHLREERLKTQIATDPHSPALYRINGPVSNLDSFYDAYKVVKSDKLYRAPKARAKIW